MAGQRADNWLSRNISLHSHDSENEERANAATHAVGALFAPVALILLVARSLGSDPVGIVLADVVFGLSMTLLYAASTLYHLSRKLERKRLFRLFDHMSIYLLIAGTYTPLMARVEAPWGARTLLFVWLLAAAGMAFKLRFWGRFRVLQVLFYLAMGWLAIIRIGDIVRLFDTPLLIAVLAGGVSYTLGTIVYAVKQLPYHHAIWHLFVLGGSVSHFIGIYSYL